MRKFFQISGLSMSLATLFLFQATNSSAADGLFRSRGNTSTQPASSSRAKRSPASDSTSGRHVATSSITTAPISEAATSFPSVAAGAGSVDGVRGGFRRGQVRSCWLTGVRDDFPFGQLGSDDFPCARRQRLPDHRKIVSDPISTFQPENRLPPHFNRPAHLGSDELPIRNASIACAHWRPSRIAHTTSDWPRRMSPAANTFATLVR